MPRKYLLELICDFLSACRTYGGNPKDEYDWWIKNSPKMKIHPKTKHFIKEVFWQLHCHVDEIPLKDAIRLADNKVNKYDIFFMKETILLTDGYKINHHKMYPVGIEMV